MAKPAAAQDPVAPTPPPCFDLRIEFVGRTPVQLVANVQYFRWTYRVYGARCINRALSHWAIGICSTSQVSAISTQSMDSSDPPGGLVTWYVPTLGKDPETGLAYAIKWDYAAGNPIDKLNEYDEFSFVATGPITTLVWAAKGARMTAAGTVQGPACLPVPVLPTTWGGIKARFN